MTGCDISTLTEGAIEADFAAIEPRCIALAEQLSAASTIRITAPGGSDIRASLQGRTAVAGTGFLRSPGMVGGCPDIEAYIAPVEGTANGKMVIDASGTGLGLLSEPLEIEVVDGRAAAIRGTRAPDVVDLLDRVPDPRRRVLAEIGIGLNPAARVIGSIIEDEATYGTGHFAFGSNETFGGANRADLHLDLVYWQPTVQVDDQEIMRGGALVGNTPA
jgi:leucyl aminopeptidase (aminopeptidase T)